MQGSIESILQDRIKAYQNNTLERKFILEGKEYQKKWAEAVQFFQKIINKERSKSKQTELPFMAIRSKLIALREIDDLRWFYKQCLIYRQSKKGNTFSKCFFVALKIK